VLLHPRTLGCYFFYVITVTSAPQAGPTRFPAAISRHLPTQAAGLALQPAAAGGWTHRQRCSAAVRPVNSSSSSRGWCREWCAESGTAGADTPTAAAGASTDSRVRDRCRVIACWRVCAQVMHMRQTFAIGHSQVPLYIFAQGMLNFVWCINSLKHALRRPVILH
jgi:hypothetical protein